MKTMEISIVIPLLTGWLAGWLLNYIADVLPATRRLSAPTCRYCGEDIRWSDYLTFRACRACGRRRNLRTAVVQVLAVLVSLYLWIAAPARLGYLLSLFVATYFLLVLIIDLEHRLILHPVSIVGAALGMLAGSRLHGILPTIEGGLAGLGIMLLLYLFGRVFARIRARRLQAAGHPPDDEEALGQGDVILASVLGLILGWPLIWFGLLIAILLGGLVGLPILLAMLISRRYRTTAWMVFIPYGPFLIASATLLVFLPRWVGAIVPR